MSSSLLLLSSSIPAALSASCSEPPSTSETLIATVTVRPDTERLDGMIAFGPEGAESLDRGSVQVRFNPNGELDALDGTSYRAVRKLRYAAGRIYDLRIVVNVPRRSFDVYVTPATEAPVLVARDFAFNAAASSADRSSAS